MTRKESLLSDLGARFKLPGQMIPEEIEENKARQQRRAESLIGLINRTGDSVLFGQKLNNYLEWSELRRRGVLSERLEQELSVIESLFRVFFGDWQDKVIEAWKTRPKE